VPDWVAPLTGTPRFRTAVSAAAAVPPGDVTACHATIMPAADDSLPEAEISGLISPETLDARWQERWPRCRPVGYELRGCARATWVRFHTLSGSKRYAEGTATGCPPTHMACEATDPLRHTGGDTLSEGAQGNLNAYHLQGSS
jgi:hypothetical protein